LSSFRTDGIKTIAVMKLRSLQVGPPLRGRPRSKAKAQIKEKGLDWLENIRSLPARERNFS
jgi:hypothetical protein